MWERIGLAGLIMTFISMMIWVVCVAPWASIPTFLGLAVQMGAVHYMR